MRKTIRILVWIIIISGILTFAEFIYLQKNKGEKAPLNQNNTSEQIQNNQEIIPDALQENTPADNSASSPAPESESIPEKFLLNMPFYSQAPSGNWDTVHEEMCEEASVLNAGLYLLNKKISKEAYEKELGEIKKLEEKLFSDYKSTTIAETKKFTNEYFEGAIKTKVIDNPSIEDIEKEVAAGHPVIVPLAGRDIGNPNFTPPGPVYHMLVVKGYDTTNFITNDVGTRKGNSYTYKKNVIMKNMHDWDKVDIHRGAKRVLVLYK